MASPLALSGCAGTMISQSAFAAGAGAADAGALAVGAGALAVGAGALAVADGQGVAAAEVAVTGIVAEDPAGADVAEDPAGADVAEDPAEADVADPSGAGTRQGFALAALTEASSTVLTCGVTTAAIPTASTATKSPIISAGRRRRGSRSSWLR